MKCETCGHDMVWQGSIRAGHMVCDYCSSAQTKPGLTEALQQAAAEFQRKVDANKQFDMYKQMVGQEAPKPMPMPTVKWLCLKCGYNIVGIKGRNPQDYACPRCFKYGSLKEVT